MKMAIGICIALWMQIGTFAAVTTTCEHPAANRAVELVLAEIGDAKGENVRLEVDGDQPELNGDGYTAVREGDAVVVRGARPRSLLFAAGEVSRWRFAKEGDGKIVREAAFKMRCMNFTGREHGVADWVAATGANVVQLGRNAPPRMVDECKAADVAAYAFLYGCDPMKWNRKKCEEFLAAHPSARAVDPGRSWEKGIMCPSDPATWEYFAAYITDIAKQADYEGVCVTFWDDYGLNCRCSRCRANGLDKFSRQVAAVVKCFEDALAPLGKKLIVRTWSSGAPHFLGGEWVHAPGYGGSGGEPLELWGDTYRNAKRGTIFQTKVYNSDCQPNPPFSLLLGKAHDAGFCELAEWQITGQTVGLGWLPASVVNHTAWTMKKAFALNGGEGVCLYAGGYQNHGYEALDDIMNSINIYAWRQLSWNPDDDVGAIWLEWAKPRYGKGAEDMAKALALTETPAVVAFSPLGLGTYTESRYDSNVVRREDHLRYTNRHYLPEGQAALAPTKENIERVIREKDDALATMDAIDVLVERYRNSLNAAGATPKHYEEVKTRMEWLRTTLVVAKALDSALWRYRYLRHLGDNGISDLQVLKDIEGDFDVVRQNHRRLFEHSPDLRLSCYGGQPCGDREITLRSPIPLMRDIHSNAVHCVERILGPR